jgi:hypothetical protein
MLKRNYSKKKGRLYCVATLQCALSVSKETYYQCQKRHVMSEKRPASWRPIISVKRDLVSVKRDLHLGYSLQMIPRLGFLFQKLQGIGEAYIYIYIYIYIYM